MIGWMIEALIASTILMVVVLVLRGPVRKAFGAEIAYALWALPVLRLLLPPLPASWHEAAVTPISHATETVTVLFIDPVADVAAAAPGVAWAGPVMAGLWIAGAAAFIVWHSLAHRRFCKRMLAETAETERRGDIRVIETDAASGPLAFGIWHRYVAFPRDFAERYDAEERDLALAHELGHHARGDLLANWVALLVLALHWFNPIAWRAFRAFRADQEIANDARVLAGMNPMRRHTYACAILKAAHGGSVSAACHLHTIDDLKGRLRMLTTIKTSRVRLLTGAGALTLLAAAGLGLTASGTAAAAKVRTTVETATGVTFSSLDQTAPVAPIAPVPHASSAPVAPRAPVAASSAAPLPAPPAPPAIVTGENGVTTTVSPDGKVTRTRVRVIVRENGKIVRSDDREVAATPPVPAVPQISSVDCKSSGNGGVAINKMVLNDSKDGKRKIILCINRIQKVAEANAAKGVAMAANSKEIERNAYRQALAGLRKARAEMVAKQGESGGHSSEALPAIDTAIAEIEADLAGVE